MDSTFQFSCPSCGALLQALLKENLTSVQCGECLDVFDVQMPNLCAPARQLAPLANSWSCATCLGERQRGRVRVSCVQTRAQSLPRVSGRLAILSSPWPGPLRLSPWAHCRVCRAARATPPGSARPPRIAPSLSPPPPLPRRARCPSACAQPGQRPIHQLCRRQGAFALSLLRPPVRHRPPATGNGGIVGGVSMNAAAAAPEPVPAPTVAPAAAAPTAPTAPAVTADDEEASAAKRQKVETPSTEATEAPPAALPEANAVSVAAMAEHTMTPEQAEDSTMNLESSLQSCTAHRERILQARLRRPPSPALARPPPTPSPPRPFTPPPPFRRRAPLDPCRRRADAHGRAR